MLLYFALSWQGDNGNPQFLISSLKLRVYEMSDEYIFVSRLYGRDREVQVEQRVICPALLVTEEEGFVPLAPG